MKDPVSESGEFSDSEANTLEHLCFVVAAFSKAIGVVAVESVQDRFAPVMKYEELLYRHQILADWSFPQDRSSRPAFFCILQSALNA